MSDKRRSPQEAMTIALERLDMEMHTETKEVERLPDGSRVMESSWNVEGVAADLIADVDVAAPDVEWGVVVAVPGQAP